MANNDLTRTVPVATDGYDLFDTLSHLLRRSHFHAEAMFSKTLGHHGITSRQLALLVAVAQQPGRSQRQIGETTALDMNTVSDLLRRMEKNCLIERRASDTDGRSIQIRLSRKGARVLSAMRDENTSYQKQLTERLTEDESADLKRLLRRLLELEGRDIDS